MLIFTHAATGALIGQAVPGRETLAFLFAFFLHFAIDMIPHGDSLLYKEYANGTNAKKGVIITIIDLAATVTFIVALFQFAPMERPMTVAMGVFGGLLPDLLSALYGVFGISRAKWLNRVHFYFHDLIVKRTGDLSLKVGMTMEVIIASILCVRVF